MHHQNGISYYTFRSIMDICQNILGYEFYILGTRVTLWSCCLFGILVFNVLYWFLRIYQND